jgi:hypothetical protein
MLAYADEPETRLARIVQQKGKKWYQEGKKAEKIQTQRGRECVCVCWREMCKAVIWCVGE